MNIEKLSFECDSHANTYTIFFVWIILFLVSPIVFSQNCNQVVYSQDTSMAIQDLKDRKYKRAINLFLDARDVCPEKKWK